MIRLLLFCGLIAAGISDLFARAHPNILLIITDDQGFGDVSSHGFKHLKTPNHDLIAQEGAPFDRFFVSPVCAPTRASLLTGRYNLRSTGITEAPDMIWATLNLDDVTIPECLHQLRIHALQKSEVMAMEIEHVRLTAPQR